MEREAPGEGRKRRESVRERLREREKGRRRVRVQSREETRIQLGREGSKLERPCCHPAPPSSQRDAETISCCTPLISQPSQFESLGERERETETETERQRDRERTKISQKILPQVTLILSPGSPGLPGQVSRIPPCGRRGMGKDSESYQSR